MGTMSTKTRDEDILDTAEACRLLDVSEPVLRDAMRRQGLPYRRIGAKHLRFSRSALIAWIAAGDSESDLRDDGADEWVNPGANGAFSQPAPTRRQPAPNRAG